MRPADCLRIVNDLLMQASALGLLPEACRMAREESTPFAGQPEPTNVITAFRNDPELIVQFDTPDGPQRFRVTAERV